MEVQGGMSTNSRNLEATLPPDLFRQGVMEQAECLGMNPEVDSELLWIAERSLLAPLPPNWAQLTTDSNQIYYYNSATGESDWNHPSDEAYRQLYLRKKAEQASTGGLLENFHPNPPAREGVYVSTTSLAYADHSTGQIPLSPSNSNWPISPPPPPPPRLSVGEGRGANALSNTKWEDLLAFMRQRMNESLDDTGVVKNMVTETEGILSALKEENTNIFPPVNTSDLKVYSESEYEELCRQITSLKEEIDASKSQIEALRTDLKKNQESSRATTEKMNTEMESLNTRLSECGTVERELKLKNESLTRQLTDSKDEVAFLRTSTTGSQKMIDDLKSSAQRMEIELRGQLNELEESTAQVKSARKSLEEQLRESKCETSAVRAQSDGLQTELNNVQTTSNATEQMLNEQIEELKAEKNESQRVANDLLSARDNRILELETNNSLAAEQYRILKDLVDDKIENEKKKNEENSETRQKLKEEIDRLNACLGSLKNDMKERDIQLLESQADSQAFKDELSLSTRALSDAKKSSEALQKEVDILKLDAQTFKEKWRNEQNRSKELNSKLADLQGSIRVLCRVRPLSFDEKRDDESLGTNSVQFLDYDKLLFHGTEYIYDHVFDGDTEQTAVYDEVSSTVATSMNGVNVCIFAYGQTASGKTYTMEGLANDRGVNVRALESLFEIGKSSQDIDYTFSVSILEVYNESVRDLLSRENHTKLDVRMGSNGVYVEGLTKHDVESGSDVEQLIALASSNRVTANNNINDLSSRSHLVLTCYITGTKTITGATIHGKLNLIDLAGSERLKNTEAEGLRLKEAQNINRSLSALGDVVAALGNNSKHVPYRNSKLTFLLQESLRTNAKVLMFVNINPSTDNAGESICSLNFAKRCRSVQLGKARKDVSPNLNNTRIPSARNTIQSPSKRRYG
uniref:Kinesin-like protein n=1 Tax=Leptocylindrus danicus TaxID=163516 RepID=A0A7S2PFW9_9STRA|mmetsp:Transcript_3259/g.4741  ORF Transcript_3259/g.4741 Transcript_3259/m.4741 type:complete len:918 (+) Transcript_3259:84-2837(+)|eukprot:CAMPEP_0116015588 /NCGR_PEP_ID=MMETSP0321-20121206/6937_1 /TAXON_ID=163516 /ORGANISM="Leptocylindrus danicus var. danicus, Strain B650" /LENGTH=917 /DNA_ID=CAMNT_0003485409 /DNA_START=62 /DNA_END=2815 /DNA_ORIENTATION=-